ncbi:hypothetical protein J5X84_42925 [Streptosporangiaceae bacterium NEAU-GS5]|nr:hypothetical protein [Streptosporangiaceae bacterium NEAU-GS5]
MIITLIKAVISVDAGWAVGAADRGIGDVDKDLLTDDQGRPWIPATSLAGSLRAHLAEHGIDEDLMGSRSAAPELLASKLWLLGTQIPEPVTTEVVAATAIDPQRKAATPKSLRHARIVDEPAHVELYMMHEGNVSDDHLQLLAGWRPAIGGNRTTGGGQARLQQLAYRHYDLNRDDDLRDWLTLGGPDRFTGLTDVVVPEAQDHTIIEVRFAIVDGLHIGSGFSDLTTKAALTRTRKKAPIVPGSSWKGLFRARTGYILRTVGMEACTDQQGCRQCPLCTLFGSAANRGKLAFHDSVITDPDIRQRTHVAIDRITGGARDQLLFAQNVLLRGQLKLKITALAAVEEWERNLLWHVIRDLDDELIGVGAGTQRGQGTLRVTSALTAPQPVAAP